jgi:hypothetical protein
MAATPSIQVVKQSPFEGSTRRWSNRYHFSGGTPSGSGPWTTLSDAIVTDEAACLGDQASIVETLGYAAGSDVPVFSKTYSTAGGIAGVSGVLFAPLWCCALIRYSTTQRTSKNHPIYLFNYMHQVLIANSSDRELLYATQKTALEEYADDWLAGFSDGVNTYVRAGPNGAVAQSRLVGSHVTHRDFPT